MPGVTASEIKIGQTMPYSGPASAYATIGKTETAYFKMVNEQGGINGRKITLISVDDGYNPSKTVEQIRDLVENQHVAFLFNTLGTPQNTAIHKYLNDAKIPQLFVATGADKWGDYEHFPWTMGWQPSYQVEARIYAKYLLKNKPDAKIALLYQNDDFGKDYLTGLKQGLGDKADKMLIADSRAPTTEPTVDSARSCRCKAPAPTPSWSRRRRNSRRRRSRRSAELGWKPTFLHDQRLDHRSPSGDEARRPRELARQHHRRLWQGSDRSDLERQPGHEGLSGLDEEIRGLVRSDRRQQPLWFLWLQSIAQTMVQVLKQCGGDLNREEHHETGRAVLGITLPVAIPGIKVTTSATDFHPIKQMQLQKFNGTTWVLFGEVISGATGS